MHITISASNLPFSQGLSEYVTTRLWVAMGRSASHVSWIGVRLAPATGDTPGEWFACRLDAWVRGVGTVTVVHADQEARIAVDRAAARLKHAVDRSVVAVTTRTSDDRWCDDWHAERVWEDDGGRVATARGADKATCAGSIGASTHRREVSSVSTQDNHYTARPRTPAAGGGREVKHDQLGDLRGRAPARARQVAGR